ncbi:unnamed protein product [Ectocarpus sp. 12 AP-2014]
MVAEFLRVGPRGLLFPGPLCARERVRRFQAHPPPTCLLVGLVGPCSRPPVPCVLICFERLHPGVSNPSGCCTCPMTFRPLPTAYATSSPWLFDVHQEGPRLAPDTPFGIVDFCDWF